MSKSSICLCLGNLLLVGTNYLYLSTLFVWMCAECMAYYLQM